MLTLQLTDEDVIRLQMIEVDHDATGALAFIQERILPELKNQQQGKMRGHLDGGKGSVL